MEKHGMARRNRSILTGFLIRGEALIPRPFRTGLLIFLNFLLLAAVYADNFPEVRIETFPASPTVNSPWSVYVMVRHSNPMDVNIHPPHFPPFLVLDRVRGDVRILNGGERWTRVEYRFVPLRPYSISLGSFEVTTPAGRTVTNEIDVSFGAEIVGQHFQPQFRWVTPIPSVAPGQTAVIFLELTNWNPNRRIPEGIFLGRAPINAILGEGLAQTVTPGVHRYPISIIPLEESNITLAAFSFAYANYNLNIPGIGINVLPAGVIVEEPLLAEIIQEESLTSVIPFPQYREGVFFLFQNEYDRIISRTRALWNDNRRAEALAELRRNERDSFAGPFLVQLRQEIELELGLAATENERWRPLRIPLAVYAGLILAIAAALVFTFVLRPRWINQGKKMVPVLRNSFLSAIILMIVIGLGIIFLAERLGDFPSARSSSSSAVLRSTYAYRIPDFRGAVNDWFNEGQPVIVSAYDGDWSLAETPDGRSGWVPREVVIMY